MSSPITPTNDLGISLDYDDTDEVVVVEMALTAWNDWLLVSGLDRLVQDLKFLFYTRIGADVQNPTVGCPLLDDVGQPAQNLSVYAEQVNQMLVAFKARQANDAAQNQLSLDEQLDTYTLDISQPTSTTLRVHLVIQNMDNQTADLQVSIPL